MTAHVTAEEAAVLRRQHQEKLRIYEKVLSGEVPYFDVVVVTAGDEDQTETYRSNIKTLSDAGRIPKATKYVVLPDPPGRRVGCGGAAFYVLRHLKAEFGSGFEALRVLLIHAGGYSKRLPNHSHCGKIFSLLPVPAPADSSAAMTMLELKLATFAHVPAQIPEGKGGVFTTCSDDLVFYDHTVCDFSGDGFTAFGHPSPVTIGKDHGVFVLKEPTQKPGTQQCVKFLHKPPIEKQREEKAVVGKTQDEEDEVYTDSSYFWSGRVSALLLDLFEGTLGGKVEAEVDAYGDFMHPLGPGATEEYMMNFGNTAKKDDEKERDALLAVRRAIHSALKGVQLHCLALPGSRFYHVGTIPEALHHFCMDGGFLTAIGRGRDEDESKVPKDNVCLIESLVAPGAVLGPAAGGDGGTVVEFSRVGDGCRVGAQSVLSGVVLEPGVVVPPRTFLQTLPLRTSALPDSVQKSLADAGQQEPVVYVTHVLGSFDDIKKVRQPDEKLAMFGGGDVRTHIELPAASLWTARLFAVAPSASASLRTALEMQSCLVPASGEPTCPAAWASQRGVLVSLADCVTAKALPVQQQMRSELHADIKASL
eukprot:TRINITY_DN5371_c0_g3_i1.p1 TRINITY_DN5371_c0_g3~~TRINITY_DN5371_c0_g3_i1.p1  ORF type:complete len:616 (+),score=179.79 TRINITY_DN5371_c0_g3_i1:76-1848(+)